MDLMLDGIESPCKADTEYESAVVFGDAKMTDDPEVKQKVLREFANKYIPDSDGMEISDNMENGTAVVEITIKKITGKYHS